MNVLRRAATCAVLFACACATPSDPYKLDGPRTGAGIEIVPYALREECFTLDKGEGIDFYFTSTAALAFNLHYHDGNAVVMPIERSQTSGESGDFLADRKEIYCLMWEAGAEAALIDYRVRPLPKRP
jgi:hypothetical protein